MFYGSTFVHVEKYLDSIPWLEPSLLLILALVLVSFSAFGLRALSSLGLARARYLVDDGNKKLEPFVAQPAGYIMTLFLLDLVGVVGTFWVGYELLDSCFKLETWTIWLILGVVYFVFHTWLGTAFSRGDERTNGSRVVTILKPFYVVLRPLTYVLCKVLNPLSASPERRYADADRIEEEFEVMLDESERHGGLENMKGRIMRSAIDYSETTVREVMIPRTELTAFSVDTKLDDALSICVQEGYSRIPVYEGNLDTIVGIMYFKDLVGKYFELRNDDAARDQIVVGSLVREAYFVPETNHIDSIFEDFKREHVHIAIVVDEFGGTAGLVTLEDIVEEFFGDIQDEYDSEEVAIVSLDSQDHVLVDGRTNISEIGELFDVEFEEDPDFETVGGLVTSRLGHVGVVGESICECGLKFIVRAATERCVLKVEISRETPIEGDGPTNDAS